MKRNLNKWIWGLCCLLVCTVAACSEEDFASQDGSSVPREEGLYLSFLINGETPSAGETRVVDEIPGVDDLNENLVKTVDVFVFKPDGTLNDKGYVHAALADSKEAVSVYKGTGWIDNFEDGQTYTAYVVANYKGSATLAGVKTLDDLKTVVAEDVDVWKWKGMTGYTGEDKMFLMDGKLDITRSKLGDGSKEVELKVDLRRAAVKVELTIVPSDDFKTKFTATDFQVRVANYATRSTAIAEGNALAADERGFNETDYTKSLVVSRTPNEKSVARFYTYVNRWDGLAQDETMLLFDLPGNYQESTDGGEQKYEHNYYKVPIISSELPQVLERNSFYQITATVDMLGSKELDEPVTLTDVKFTVADWVAENITVGDDTQPTYLVLSDYIIDIRNADGFDNLEFYSSSPIKSIEFVSGNDAINPANEGHLEFNYPGEGSTIPSIYFVNKRNQRQSVNAGSDILLDYNKNVTNGKITLTSPSPINVTKRYLTFKVTNTDNISKYVIVEQYPLEYIQPIQGFFSYRDDFLAPEGVSPQGPVRYDKTYSTAPTTLRATQTQRYSFRGWGNSNYELTSGGIGNNISLPVENDYFTSKVYYNGSCYYYSFNDGDIDWNDPKWVWDAEWEEYTSWGTRYRRKNGVYENYSMSFEASPSSDSGNDNPMMYFVTITQTDEDYKIAHPLTEQVPEWNNQMAVVSSRENDNFVSPAFMLASQLGAVYSSDISGWTEARKHCAYYVETYQNEKGETVVLDDWRLPTSAEIQVIIDYQNNPNTQDVMEEVLGGQYYYVSWSEARNGNGSAATGNNDYADRGTFIRCIRDVKPDDEFMKQ